MENFFLLSEVISPKGGPVKASSQAKRYFNLDSQAALWLMLPGWTRVWTSTVGHWEELGDSVKKYQ